MPLIDLKTDLKSLKFGKDRPGGGSSNQPYIQKDIPEGDSSSLFSTGGPDFLLRGGLMAPIKAFDDTSRLFQMFIDLKSPKGLLFTLKENLLSRTAVKTEASFGVGYAGATPPDYMTGKGGGAINAGLYTPLSTLGQSLAGFAGVHLNLLGLDPTSPMSGVVEGGLFPGAGLQRYEDIAKVNNQADANSFPETKEITTLVPNPLAGAPTLSTIFDGTTEPPFIEEISFETTGGFANRLAQIWYNKQLNPNTDPNIIEYDGGPGSILGIGKTQIKFADQRTGKNNPTSVSNPDFFYGASNSTRDKYLLRPESKEIGPKLKGVTNFASNLLPEDSDREKLANDENPNRITNKYYVLDRDRREIYAQTIPLGRTTDRFISPFGLSKRGIPKYTDFTGVSLQTGSFTSDGGQTWNPRDFQTNVYSSEAAGTFPDNTNRIHDNNTEVFSQQQIIDQENVIGDGLTDTNDSTFPEDFRKQIIKDRDITESKVLSLSPSYKTKNKNSRVSLGDPGRSNTANGTKNVFNYGLPAYEMEALDKITASPMYDGTGPDTSKAINDLVKFRIAAINNDSTNGNAVYMHFRAFVNSFQDSYNASWTPQSYVGRGEQFYTYNNFNRSISMGFTAFAQSKPELIPMYKKLNYLASTLAPDYTSAGFMRGNLVRLTLGGYLYEQPGFISSLTYDIPQESTWEIALDQAGKSDTSVKELPHMINVQLTFTPIHTFIPQKPNVANNPDERYIALANAFYSRGNYADDYRSYNASTTADIPGEGSADITAT